MISNISNKRIKKCIAVLLTMAFSLSIFISTYAENSRTATISEASGSVSIMKAGGEKTFTAFTGMTLDEGDRIITGSDGAATLEIDDDKEVKLDKDTQMSLSELRGSIASKDEQTGIGLIVGNIWSNIKKKLNIRAKYEIKTPTAVMGARGTMFGVRVTVTPASAGGSEPSVAVNLSVVEGTVSAGLQQAITNLVSQAVELQQLDVLVGHGEQISANQNQPLSTQSQVEQVTNLTLDRFTLENIRDAAQQNPERVDPSLLNNINQIIQQLQQEEKQQQQQQDQQLSPDNGININQDPGVTASQTQITSGSSGGSGNHTQQPSDSDSSEMVMNYMDAFHFGYYLSVRASFTNASALSLDFHGQVIPAADYSVITEGSDKILIYRYDANDGPSCADICTITATSQSTNVAMKYTKPLTNLNANGGYSSDGVEVSGVISTGSTVKISVESSDSGAPLAQSFDSSGWSRGEWLASGNNYAFDKTIPISSDAEDGCYDVVLYFKNSSSEYCGIIVGYLYISGSYRNFIPSYQPN